MSSYGIKVFNGQGHERFSLETRLTTLLFSDVVSADSTGSIHISVPSHLSAVVHAVALDSDVYLRHVPHKVTFNVGTGLITWAPALKSEDVQATQGFEAVGRMLRSRSRIQVIGYVES